MRKEKTLTAIADENEKAIVEGWIQISKEYTSGKLNDEEKAQIDRARFADEQAKKSSFVLGGPISLA